MKTYLVEGEFVVTVQVEIEANSEETAVELAKRRLTDNYSLDVYGYDHDPETGVEFDLEAYPESDEDDGRDDDDYGGDNDDNY